MKRRDLLTSFRSQSVTDLAAAIAKEEKHLLDLRFDHAMRKLKNIRTLRASRGTLAQMKTILREKVAQTTKEQA